MRLGGERAGVGEHGGYEYYSRSARERRNHDCTAGRVDAAAADAAAAATPGAARLWVSD